MQRFGDRYFQEAEVDVKVSTGIKWHKFPAGTLGEVFTKWKEDCEQE